MEAISKQGPNQKWRLGEILLQKGWIRWLDLEDALQIQQNVQRPIGEILVERGLVSRPLLFQALAIQFGLKFVELNSLSIDKTITKIVPKYFAYEHRVVPVAHKQDVLVLAISDPLDMWPSSSLQKLTGLQDIRVVLATPQDIEDHILSLYGPEGVTS